MALFRYKKAYKRIFGNLDSPDDKGNVKVLCPFHKEEAGSLTVNLQTGIFHCFGCNMSGSFKKFLSELYFVPLKVAKVWAKTSNYEEIPLRIPNSKVRICHKNLLKNKSVRSFLLKKKGLTIDTIREYKLGSNSESVVIPIFNPRGEPVNIRIYRKDQQPKIVGLKKHNTPRLYPVPFKEDKTVYITEGEWDTLLGRQLGINTITQTGGCGFWSPYFNKFFKDKRVVILYDNDSAGRQGEQIVARQLLPIAKSVKILHLPVPNDKEDFSDWVLKYGGTRQKLRTLTKETTKTKEAHLLDAPDISHEYSEGYVGEQYDELDALDRFLRRQKLLFELPSSRWMRYSGKVWRDIQETTIERELLTFLGTFANANRIRNLLFLISKKVSSFRGKEVLVDKVFSPTQSAKYLAFNNGTYDVCEDVFLEGIWAPEHFTTADYTDLDYRKTDWKLLDSMLDTMLQDNRDILETKKMIQMFAGSCLEFDHTEQFALFVIGRGANGKTALVNVLKTAFPEKTVSHSTMSEIGQRFGRYGLYQKLLNVSGEEDDKLLHSPIFKLITGKDKIAIERKGHDVFYYKPICKMIFIGNALSFPADTSEGLYRRFRILEIKHSFHRDTNRVDNIDTLVSEDRLGLINFVLEGHRILKQENWKIPQTKGMRSALSKFKLSTDNLRRFLSEETEPVSDIRSIPVKELYSFFSDWSRSEGIRNIGAPRFRHDLENKNYKLVQVKVEGGERTEWRVLGLNLRRGAETSNEVEVVDDEEE